MKAYVWKRKWTWEGEKRHAWVLEWRERGKRKRRTYPTRDEANAALSKLLLRRRLDAGLLPDIAFKEFIPVYEKEKGWRSERYQEVTLYILRKNCERFHELLLADIGRERLEEFKRDRLAAVSPSTVRNDLAALSDFFRFAVRKGYLAENPLKGVERPALPVKQDNPADYLTPEDAGILYGAAGRDEPLYRFAVATGLRLSELLALRWEDISKDGYVVVRKGKGRKQRIVPLLPEALRALQGVVRRLDMSRIFWWWRSRVGASRAFRGAIKGADLNPAFRFHTLRHTFASWALMSGVSIEVVAKAMGHSSTTVTRRYGHLSPDYQRKELLKMAGFGSKAVPTGAKTSEK